MKGAGLPFPTPLTAYPPLGGDLFTTLSTRVAVDPFNLVASAIFALAILHTFVAPRVAALAHRVQQRADDRARAAGGSASPSVAAEFLHFFGEVEVVFGLWAVVLLVATTLVKGWAALIWGRPSRATLAWSRPQRSLA